MTGSGKSTLARRLEGDLPAVRFSIDEWMLDLFGEHMDREDFDRREAAVKERLWPVVQRLVELGVNVVLDYGFWRAYERQDAARRVRAAGGEPVLYLLDVPLAVLKERLRERNAAPPDGTFEITPKMLDVFASRFEPPEADEGMAMVTVGPSDLTAGTCVAASGDPVA